MKEKKFNKLINQFDVFYLMTLSVAMLGSKRSEQFDSNACDIIDLIGKAYGWDEVCIDLAIELILGEMMRVGLPADYSALASTDLLDKDIAENMLLYEIKGMAVEEVTRDEMTCGIFAQRNESEVKNAMCYTMFHHDYDAHIRFAQINKRAEQGSSTALMQEALMLILGIGCSKDILLAQRILQNLLIWGIKPAAAILAFLWKREGNRDMEMLYSNVFNLLNNNRGFGCPELSFKENKGGVEDLYFLISAVRSHIVMEGKTEVDMFFADAMNCENICLKEKLEYISRYKDGNWLKGWIDKQSDKTKIGF